MAITVILKFYETVSGEQEANKTYPIQNHNK